ncbi:hypothetical protein [Streptomyces sp. NPDC029003]|uniref:hypothetical protein n=1 Tax=Streptomyces sp. NPDC029003 TaxID=3155125 RepID=UPI0033DAA2BE
MNETEQLPKQATAPVPRCARGSGTALPAPLGSGTGGRPALISARPAPRAVLTAGR